MNALIFEVADVVVDDHGSIFLVKPMTDAAREWADEHIDPAAQWFGPSLVVEPRYIGDLVDGMAGDGLLVRFPIVEQE